MFSNWFSHRLNMIWSLWGSLEFDKKLIILHPCNPAVSPDPSANFDSTFFNYRIWDLPAWCCTLETDPEAGYLFLEESILLEICSSTSTGVGQFFRIRALLPVHKPFRRCILVQILGLGKVKANIQYERLLTFCFFCGWIGHILNRCNVLKNSLTYTHISIDEFLYPEELGSLEKSQPTISFHERLPPSSFWVSPYYEWGIKECHCSSTNKLHLSDAKTWIAHGRLCRWHKLAPRQN